MEIKIVPHGSSYEQIQELRKQCDCIMFDLKKLQTNDTFIVDDDSFEPRHQPLRLVVIRLADLNRHWGILNDRFRRNTMIIATDDDIKSNPELSRFLESQGVALLMSGINADGLINLQGLIKSLSSLKFKSILVEDRIDLIKEFSS